MTILHVSAFSLFAAKIEELPCLIAIGLEKEVLYSVESLQLTMVEFFAAPNMFRLDFGSFVSTESALISACSFNFLLVPSLS